MNIALWGFGPHGNTIYRLIKEYSDNYKVTEVFDIDPDGVDLSSTPNLKKVCPSGNLRVRYKENAFEAVFVSIYDTKVRKEAEECLEDWQIPVVTREELQLSLSSKILARLHDAESMELFNSKLSMDLFGYSERFFSTIKRCRNGHRYYLDELAGPMKRAGAKRVILLVSGSGDNVNREVLELCGVPIAALCPFCSYVRPNEETIPLIRPEELQRQEFSDCIAVVSSQSERKRIHSILEELGFPRERVYDPPNSWYPVLSGYRLWQYFDVWRPKEHEIFADCGAYDGTNIIDFIKWCGGKYDEIHAFEPLPGMRQKILSMAEEKQLHDITVKEAAVWDKEELIRLDIQENPLGSSIIGNDEKTEDAVTPVQGIMLDKALKGVPVTFLKMDVEGCEEKAINGALNLIRTYKPRLAISVYHRQFDILKIPHLILKAVAEYHFCIRHYGTGMYETILYASLEPFDDGII